MKTLRLSLRSSLWICSALLVLLPSVRATNYYISNSGTHNTAGSLSTPWLDFTDVTTHISSAGPFGPGDTINLARGSSWTQALTLSGSGSSGSPIVVTAYGTGNAPVISRTSAHTDYCIRINDGSFWTIQNLELTTAGQGVSFIYSNGTFGNQGNTVQNNYLHGISLYPIWFNGGATLPSSAAQWVCKDILIQSNTIVNCDWVPWYLEETDPVKHDGDGTPDPTNPNALSAPQSHPWAYPNVTFRNNHIANCQFQSTTNCVANGLLFDNWISTIGGNYGQYHDGGLVGFINWGNDNFTYANNRMNVVPNSYDNMGHITTDKGMICLEAANSNINIFSNYIANTAGPAVEILQIPDGSTVADDHEQNILVDGNVFVNNSNPGYVTFGAIAFAVSVDSSRQYPGTSSNQVTGMVENNVSAQPPGYAATFALYPTNPVSNFTASGHDVNNLTGAGYFVYNAGNDFSGTQNSAAWSYYSSSSGTNQPMPSFTVGTVYQGADVDGIWTDASGGAVSRFEMTASTNSAAWVYRRWTAPKAGTIQIRGRMFRAVTGGGTLRVAVTAGSTFVWPTGGAQNLAANDQSGYDTEVDSLAVTQGEVIAFCLNNSSGVTSDAVVSWAPSIVYTSGGVGPGNQLLNGSFDVGTTTGWTGVSGATLSVSKYGDAIPPVSGLYGLHVTRTSHSSAAQQDIKAILTNNGTGNYSFTGWARLASGTDTGTLQLVVTDSAGPHPFAATTVTLGTTYTQMTATSIPVTWTGAITSAYIELVTGASSVDLYEDSFSLTKP